MPRATPLLVAFAALSLSLSLPVAPPLAAAPHAVASNPALIYDYRLGGLTLTAINDGQAVHANDGGVLSPKEGVSAVLASAGLPSATFTLNYGPLLVRGGGRVILIDTGIGARVNPPGRLRLALVRAGVTAASVTDVVISHPHFDHIGGLVTADGQPAFPNATIHIAADAWAALKPHSSPMLAAAIEHHLALIPADGRILPHVRAVPLPGHAPGHIGVEIENGGRTLLYASDVAHHYVASVAAPDLDNAYDGDPITAKATRKAFLSRAADKHLLLYMPHFPFPAFGYIVRDGQSFAWDPIAR